VARYVDTCDGSAGQSVQRGLFPVWYSAEVRSLVQWMCDWNGAHPDDRVHFYGFDIQFQQKADGEALMGFLSRAGLPGDDPRISGVKKCEGVVETFYPVLPEDRHRQCKDALTAIADLFAREAASLIERTSREDFEGAKIRWTALDGFEDQVYFRTDGPRASEIRDRAMASVFLGLRNLRFPGEKTVIWAHNFHIAKTAAGYFPYATMGTFLDQSLKADYVNVALVSHEVLIDWQGVGCGAADPPGEGSVENRFHELGEDFLLVDLDFPKGRPPFLKKGKVYELGWYPIVPRRHYDALVYLDVSLEMTPLGWRPCR
jgi:erythromycin esterase